MCANNFKDNDLYKICLECGKDLSAFPDVKYCPFCGRSIDSQSNSDWMLEIYNDNNKEYWYERGFDEFPYVIAHEYWRIRELCKEKQAYGVSLQIRDVMETVLKYQVLLVCAWFENNNIEEIKKDFKDKVIYEISDGNLSFGAWIDLADKITTYNKTKKVTLDKLQDGTLGDLFNLLEITKDFYKDSGFVNWRNKNIGHGALGFKEDEKFIKEIKEKIIKFKELFNKIGGLLINHKLMLGKNNINGLLLEKNIIYNSEDDLYVRINDDIDIVLEPFFKAKVQSDFLEIYYFDNQNKDKNTDELCYINNKTDNDNYDYFKELYFINIKKKGADYTKGLNSSYTSSAEDDELNQNQYLTTGKYVKQNFLMNWLSGCINKYKSGVFYLTMPRGTGKSVFTEKINTLYSHPERIYKEIDNDSNSNKKVKDNNIEVRTFHFSSRSYISRDAIEDFENQIEKQWARKFESRIIWTDVDNSIKKCREKYKAFDKAFANYLKMVSNYYKINNKDEKVLMVIDGLDEIVDTRIWDYFINLADILNSDDYNGVYVLLTSRDKNDESMSDETAGKLDMIKFTEKKEIAIDQEDYIKFLEDYIKNSLKKNIRNNESIDDLLEKSNYRIMNLGIIFKCKNDNNWQIDNKSIKDGEDSFQYYFDLLEEKYGKRFNNIEKILACLCYLNDTDGLSIDDLSYLVSKDEITLELIGNINDLMPVLRTERGYKIDGRTYKGKNRYFIAHNDIKNIIIKRYFGNFETEIFKEKVYNPIIKKLDNCFDLLLTEETDNNPDDDKSVLFLIASTVNSEYFNDYYRELNNDNKEIIQDYLLKQLENFDNQKENNRLKEKVKIELDKFNNNINSDDVKDYIVKNKKILSDIENYYSKFRFREDVGVVYFAIKSLIGLNKYIKLDNYYMIKLSNISQENLFKNDFESALVMYDGLINILECEKENVDKLVLYAMYVNKIVALYNIKIDDKLDNLIKIAEDLREKSLEEYGEAKYEMFVGYHNVLDKVKKNINSNIIKKEGKGMDAKRIIDKLNESNDCLYSRDFEKADSLLNEIIDYYENLDKNDKAYDGLVLFSLFVKRAICQYNMNLDNDFNDTIKQADKLYDEINDKYGEDEIEEFKSYYDTLTNLKMKKRDITISRKLIEKIREADDYINKRDFESADSVLSDLVKFYEKLDKNDKAYDGLVLFSLYVKKAICQYNMNSEEHLNYTINKADILFDKINNEYSRDEVKDFVYYANVLDNLKNKIGYIN